MSNRPSLASMLHTVIVAAVASLVTIAILKAGPCAPEPDPTPEVRQ